MSEEKTRRPLSSLSKLAQAERLWADAAKFTLYGDHAQAETLRRQARKLEAEAEAEDKETEQ